MRKCQGGNALVYFLFMMLYNESDRFHCGTHFQWFIRPFIAMELYKKVQSASQVIKRIETEI